MSKEGAGKLTSNEGVREAAKAELPVAEEKERPSHNLVGQRLGRKGRDTRERILAATERLLAGPPDTSISLSAVAREASLAMTTLYLYFADLTELLLALLEPVMASAEESYVARLRRRWPDEALGGQCRDFIMAFHAFWVRHRRILHLRNALADNQDDRMAECRIAGAQPLIDMLVWQMGGDPGGPRTFLTDLATVLVTGFERIVTITTDERYPFLLQKEKADDHALDLLMAEARLLELGIRDGRQAWREAN